MSVIIDTLIKYGFEPSTAEIYFILVNNGEMTVPQISEKTTFSRASIYDSLNQLLVQNYISYRKEGRVAYYKPAHPNKFFALIEQKKRDEALLEEEMRESIKGLIGAYNLSENKPGVRFFEGEEGVIEALKEVTNNFVPDTEIISFVKVKSSGQEKEFEGVFDDFIKKRIESNVRTMVLAVDSLEARNLKENDKNSFRETRLVPSEGLPLDFAGGEIFIYGNDICVVTVDEGNYFAFIVSSPIISKMLKTFFMSEWALLAL